LNDLKAVRKAIQAAHGSNRPAILRKDFTMDRYQVLEARAAGADTVLLMVSILGVKQLNDLISFSRSLDLEPLVEVNNPREMEIAVAAGARVIGVNNRNLHTFQLDLDTTSRALDTASRLGLSWQLSSNSSPDILVAALSGISTAAEVKTYSDAGIACCLIGETLMKSSDPKLKIAELLSLESSSQGLIKKTCGFRSSADAGIALENGADLIGVIFADKSPRKASIEEASQIVQVVRRYGERSDSLVKVLSEEMAIHRLQTLDPYLWFEAMGKVIKSITLRKPMVVGIFQDQSVEVINEIITATGIDLVQLHGNEDASIIEQILVPCIKVIHLPASTADSSLVDIDELSKQVRSFSNKAIAILLDSKLPGGARGGTGLEFDWSIIESAFYQKLAPVILAGGLTMKNVADASKIAGVIGVDVSSGIEIAPGQKDPELMKSFLKNAQSISS
jgi:anthranilate synthase / indole-3-glycerol phosphate synthase / phosphoribosylanthranilate isomerase